MARAHKFGSVGTKSGRSWWARYTRNGKWHTPGHLFSTDAAAWAWLRAEQRLIDTDVWTPPAERREAAAVVARAAELRDSATLGAYARQWIEHRVTRKGQPLHPRTRAEYLAYLDGILAPLTAIPIADLSPAMVAEWYAANARTPTLRHSAYSFAKTVLRTAQDVDGLIERNPCRVENAGRKPRPATSADAPVKALTHADVSTLANLVQPRDRALILLLAYCCMRSGEAVALRRSDLRFGTAADGTPFGWVAVERGISTYGGNRHEGDTKTGPAGARTVPIPPHLIPEVRAHLERWAEPGERGLLFPSTNPKMDFRTTHQIIGRAATYRESGAVRTPGNGWFYARETAGFPGLHLHWLRHWGATLWAEAGTPEPMRRAILGHAQPGMTGHYTHPDTTKADIYARRVSELAGWTPLATPPVLASHDEPAAPSQTGPLAAVLASLDTPALAATLASLDPAAIAAVMALLPPERVAAVVVALAARTPDTPDTESG